MADRDSPRVLQSLNPSSQPFFPTHHKMSDLMDANRQIMSSSPVSVNDHQGQGPQQQQQQSAPRSNQSSSDDDFRVIQHPFANNGNGNGNASGLDFARFAPSPSSATPPNVFGDYTLGGSRLRESPPAGGTTRSSPPGGPGFIAQFPIGNGTSRLKDTDEQPFTPVDPVVGEGRDRDLAGNRASDYQFTHPISSSPFQPPQSQTPVSQGPQSQYGGSGVSFARPSSALRSGDTDKAYSSTGEASLSSSLDFSSFDRDQANSLSSGAFGINTPESSNSAPTPNNQGFPLALHNRSSMSSRSVSTNYDAFQSQSNTTRGTTPLSQNYDDSNNNSHGSGSSFFKSSLAPPIGSRDSISRASSTRSYSNTSGGQNFERPPPSALEQQVSTLSFDAQAKASPFINDLLDRLLRCEYSSKEIQRELADVSRKVNFLVERALIDSTANGGNLNEIPPPQQHRGSVSGPPGMNGLTPNRLGPNGGPPMNLNGPGPQNGASNNSGPDEVRLLSQRLNTLTTSVGQLLALQTQAHMQNVSAGFNVNAIAGGAGSNNQSHNLNHNGPNNTGNGSNGPIGLGINAPNGMHMGGGGPGNGPQQTHMLPNRPDVGVGLGPPPNRGGIRGPGPSGPGPQRQWSTGNFDIQRSASDAGIMGPMMRDKRKMSVGLLRRDSTSTLDGEGNSRDGGPVISKWESLPLLPDLLRSIAKYGVGPPNKIQQRALPFLLRGSDIIAQAPPTQERIAAYIIPAIHIALTHMAGKPTNRGPIAVIISTTVDQATQAQRMIRDLGGPIGVRSALGVGTGGDVVQELRLLQQSMPHILCGTPQKLHALFTSPGGLPGHEVRFLVLDEVDQLIARNLHEFVFNIVKLFPAPRSRPVSTPGAGGATTPIGSPAVTGGPPNLSSFELSVMNINNSGSTVTDPSPSFTPSLRRFSTALEGDSPIVGTPGAQTPGGQGNSGSAPTSAPERQTALFSNTVPQDVLNLANAIQLREPVRVLVRRDGNVTHADTSNGARGLRQFYLYLAFTAGARADSGANPSTGGLGIIGSGRGATSAETAQAREWKLDALADLFDDIEVAQAIVHVGGLNSLESVVYKLVSRGLEAVPLHGDMNAGTKLAALNKFRGASNPIGRPPITKVLVTYDVQVKAPDVFQVPLVINYDLPKAVEEYAHRVAPAISSSYSRAGVVINFVTATGGDVEMLRSIECFYKIKCPEVPMSLRDVI